MSTYEDQLNLLLSSKKTWLITGVAGFIGSNILAQLLKHNQSVVGLDNFSTGKKENLEDVKIEVSKQVYNSNFQMIEGTIENLETCIRATRGVDYILHLAALGSVPRSIDDPITSNSSNVDGTLNIFWAAKKNNIPRVVYSSSSSVYGDHPALPKFEDVVGKPLSPYAVTKKVAELYAEVFSNTYGLELVGLRYFNVFGPRQDPSSVYAAVIPRWVEAMIKGKEVLINGDGETSRDFTYIKNIVQLNILSALHEDLPKPHMILNGACCTRTTLNELFEKLRIRLLVAYDHIDKFRPKYVDFRAGDIRHSEANIDLAKQTIGYEPSYSIDDGLDESLEWYKSSIN